MFWGRFDVAYNHALQLGTGATAYPTKKISHLIASKCSGGTPTTTIPEFWGGDIAWISPKDFGDKMQITSSELLITRNGQESARLKVLPIGTVVLVVRSGILAHSLPTAVLEIPATINQDIKALRLLSHIDPSFFAYYLNINQERLLPLIRKHGATVHSVNTPELLRLEIPLPPIDIQRRLVAELDAARAERDSALAEAERLLTSIEDLVKEMLGLHDLPMPKRTGYAIRLSNAKKSNTLSPDYFHPERMQAVRQIQSLPSAPLCDLVSFQRNTVKSPGDARYIGLASVASNTGQLTDATENASGQGFIFGTGDVLYGRLRPYLNKVWLAAFTGVCSTEFHVLRPLDSRKLRPEYLAVVMRTNLIVAQTKHMMTGNTHPRLANEDVVNLFIPLTDEKTQQEIVKATLERQAEAARLRTHAENVWKNARTRFEEQLLNGGAG